MTTVIEAYADIYPWPKKLKPACQNAIDPDVFFPFTQAELDEALGYCAHCPIFELCRTIAVTRKETGVWGGELMDHGKPSLLPKEIVKEKKRKLAKAS